MSSRNRGQWLRIVTQAGLVLGRGSLSIAWSLVRSSRSPFARMSNASAMSTCVRVVLYSIALTLSLAKQQQVNGLAEAKAL